jgi:hypothetical protein
MKNIQEKYTFFKSCSFLYEINSGYRYYFSPEYIIFAFESTMEFEWIGDECFIGVLLSINKQFGEVRIYEGWSGSSLQLEEALKIAEPRKYESILNGSNILWNLDYFT